MLRLSSWPSTVAVVVNPQLKTIWRASAASEFKVSAS